MKFYGFNTSSDKVSLNYSLLLRLLNTKRKPSGKKRSTGPVSDRSIGVDFEFYRSGRENPDRFPLCNALCELALELPVICLHTKKHGRNQNF